jgi:uncharacterized protein
MFGKIAVVASLAAVTLAAPLYAGNEAKTPPEAGKVKKEQAQQKDEAAPQKGAGEKKEPEIDYAAAFKGLKPLAEKGDVKAQVQVAYLYYAGKGTAQDYKEAAAWFRKAASKGSATAEVNLGKMYATGTGVAQDDKEAAKFFRLAANRNHADGQLSLGLAYFLGKGVPKDGKAAYMWVSLAAAQGNDLAKKIVGQVGAEITPEQRDAGGKLAKEWKPEKQ